ncbi:GNAT family N-acetyltransferase [Vibrio mediterranei]|jgi:ribosomal protein S18 acetylase RimI-like enzyme|uniref:GNAT family N-acetyltransferase n=1 Tax=Vibrio mediterranei TaxID=689 RepID=UPI001EFE70A9|nr:GNAT family N-acetyltransferase [Vibrio mediterranei]MCG9628981.1 GNAT family N-acetyltransferase [Vibrio mediterranei]
MKNYQIRPYQTEDKDALKELLYELDLYHYQNAPCLYNAPEKVANLREQSDFFSNVIKNEYVTLISHNQGHVFGYIHGFIKEVNSIVSQRRKIGFVQELVISSEARGFGLGKKMLMAFETEIQRSGVTEFHLSVASFNHIGEQLYKNLGYKTVSTTMVKRV